MKSHIRVLRPDRFIPDEKYLYIFRQIYVDKYLFIPCGMRPPITRGPGKKPVTIILEKITNGNI